MPLPVCRLYCGQFHATVCQPRLVHCCRTYAQQAALAAPVSASMSWRKRLLLVVAALATLTVLTTMALGANLHGFHGLQQGLQQGLEGLSFRGYHLPLTSATVPGASTPEVAAVGIVTADAEQTVGAVAFRHGTPLGSVELSTVDANAPHALDVQDAVGAQAGVPAALPSAVVAKASASSPGAPTPTATTHGDQLVLLPTAQLPTLRRAAMPPLSGDGAVAARPTMSFDVAPPHAAEIAEGTGEAQVSGHAVAGSPEARGSMRSSIATASDANAPPSTAAKSPPVPPPLQPGLQPATAASASISAGA